MRLVLRITTPLVQYGVLLVSFADIYDARRSIDQGTERASCGYGLYRSTCIDRPSHSDTMLTRIFVDVYS